MIPLRIATRGSALALWQARFVAEALRRIHSATEISLVEVKTAGDLNQKDSLAQIGGAGLFTKEVQRAVLDGRADLAVHSLKDLPTEEAAGLRLAAVPARGAVEDAFLSLRFPDWRLLPAGAAVATGSPRRRAQLLRHRPDLRLVDLRGNVDTRLRKLHAGEFDAMILAVAGLERLGQAAAITRRLPVAEMLPAAGQGALGIECRADDQDTLALLAALDHPPTHRATMAERGLLRALGGGCQMPVGAHAEAHGMEIRLRAGVFHPRGEPALYAEDAGPDPLAAATSVADRLLALGAQTLLSDATSKE